MDQPSEYNYFNEIYSQLKSEYETISQLTPTIFISGNPDPDQIKKLGIVNIVRLTNYYENLPRYDNSKLKNYLHLPLSSDPFPWHPEHIRKILTSIHTFQNEGPTLIHCSYGIDRAPNIAILYLMARGWPEKIANELLYENRPHIRLHREDYAPDKIVKPILKELRFKWATHTSKIYKSNFED